MMYCMIPTIWHSIKKQGKTIEKVKRKVVSRDSQEGEGEDTSISEAQRTFKVIKLICMIL